MLTIVGAIVRTLALADVEKRDLAHVAVIVSALARGFVPEVAKTLVLVVLSKDIGEAENL